MSVADSILIPNVSDADDGGYALAEEYGEVHGALIMAIHALDGVLPEIGAFMAGDLLHALREHRRRISQVQAVADEIDTIYSVLMLQLEGRAKQ